MDGGGLRKDWLPTNTFILKQHPYCTSCGKVKNISSDTGKKIGYFTNILARIKKDLEEKGYKISKTQIRLITNELSTREIGDAFSLSYSKQKLIFTDIVSKYIKINKKLIQSYL
jgi:hypothetical protein